MGRPYRIDAAAGAAAACAVVVVSPCQTSYRQVGLRSLGEHIDTTRLNRAGGMLRGLAEPGWDHIADTVIDAVRATPRGGWPLRVATPLDPTAEGTTAVSDLVLRGVLARAVRLDELCVPSLIDVAIDGTELTRIRIELTARYGSELRAVAEHVKTTTAAIVEDLLGDIAAIDDRTDVIITEIVDGDPLTQ